MKKRWCIKILIILIISVISLSLFSLNINALSIKCNEWDPDDCWYVPSEPHPTQKPDGGTCSCRIFSCGQVSARAVCGVATNDCWPDYEPVCTKPYAEQCYVCHEGSGRGPTAAAVGIGDCEPYGYGCLSSACTCKYDGGGGGAKCGNGRIDEGEQCDGNNKLGGKTCQSFDYTGGTLKCYPKCHAKECTFDISSCKGDGTPPPSPPSSNPPPDTTEPGCDCTSWVQVGGCHERCSGFLQVRYERTCTPAGCDATAKCREHPSCCICTEWQTVGGCGEQGCPSNKVKQTRHCPVDCDIETRCKKMDYCSDCTLTSAKWTLDGDEISEVDENTIVTLEVEGSSLCDGSLTTFDIKEKDTLGYDEYSPDPDPVVFSNGKATVTWKADWMKDEFNFLTMDNDPEFYFIARIDSKEVTSGELKVNPVLGECGDAECDTGETPVNCPEDCGCKANEKACVINDEIVCVPYEFECDAPLTCEDDFCLPGLICVIDNGNVKCSAVEEADGYCPSDPLIQPYDPDCCNMQNAYWSTYCTGAGKTVILSVVGDEVCDGKELDIKIYEDDEAGIYLPSPNPATFDGDLATTYWETVYLDDGMGQGNPEFYYTATINELNINSNLMEVVNCNVEQDADCDGINDDNDLCWNTPECSDVNDEGCTKGQASCLIYWDCSFAEWSECDEVVENRLYRDVTLCTYTGDLNSPCNDIELLPKTKECAPEEAFPFFTAFNLVVAVIIISLYYFFFFIKKEPKKKKK
jgi:hypothetical protein